MWQMMTESASRTIGYLRVSKETQDLDKNRADILTLANREGTTKIPGVKLLALWSGSCHKPWWSTINRDGGSRGLLFRNVLTPGILGPELIPRHDRNRWMLM